jgi:isorenieratene synthase
LLEEPDAALLARGLVDLTRVWPTLRGSLLHQTIRRNPATHTLFDSDGNQLGVDTPWAGISACGDWVRYPHPSLYLERATVTGIAAANAALAAANRPPYSIREATRPEPLARLIEAGLKRIRAAARNRKRSRNADQPW